MAVVKWNPSKRQKFSNDFSSMRRSTDTTSATEKLANSFPYFLWNRIITEDPDGKVHIITRMGALSYGNNGNSFPKKTYQTSRSWNHHKNSSKNKKNNNENIIMKNFYKICGIAVILACNVFLWWFLTSSSYCQLTPLKIDDIEASLQSTVIGQEEALKSLMLTLYRASNFKTQPPVLILSGSTGVGKSFISDILINNFKSVGHAELIHRPAPFYRTVVANLHKCKHNLLVLDALSSSDAHEMANWAAEVQGAAILEGKQVWMVLCFTTLLWSPNEAELTTSDAEFLQDVSNAASKIEETFRRNSVATQVIALKPMEVDHVRSCVWRALSRTKLVASEQAVEKIVEDLTATPLQRRKGCKQVLNYLLRAGPELVSLKEDHHRHDSKDDF